MSLTIYWRTEEKNMVVKFGMTVFETDNYVVVVGVFPDGEDYAKQGCYIVRNKHTGVPELFVNLLPKAIYLAREAETFLKEVMEEDKKPTEPVQLNLIN
jgi:hypothetical protein